MIKEMYVSSTPHETKVGITEDDQLAEIFYERENEYTLAGSIYKGRVTRVLPGMQSAFVDIGLERDAFLYVSDFLDLGELDDEDIGEVPVRPETYVTNKPEPERKTPEFLKATEETPAPEIEEPEADEEFEEETTGPETAQTSDERPRSSRRRRRGRRGRSFPETKFARPSADNAAEDDEEQEEPEPQQDRVLLPGESISKYRRPAVVSEEPTTSEEIVEHHEAPEPQPEVRQQTFRVSQEPAPIVLPGESLRKYRRDPEPERVETPEPERVQERERQPMVPANIEPAALAPEQLHPEPTPQAVVSPMMLPGESIRKYQRRVDAQPDSPDAEETPKADKAETAKASETVEPPVAEVEPPVQVEPQPETKVDEEPTEASARVEMRSDVSPFLLPGEMLRKYRNRRSRQETVVAPETAEPEAEVTPAEAAAVAETETVPGPQETAGDVAGAQAQEPEAQSQTAEETDVVAERAEEVAPELATYEEVSAPSVFAPSSEQPEVVSAEPVGAVDSAADETASATTSTPDVQAELAETRPHVEEDENTAPAEPVSEVTLIERRPFARFEPTPAGTLEHEEMEPEDFPDDEHEFSGFGEVGTYDDGIFEELEEETLERAAVSADLNGETIPGETAGPFVIEGGYDVVESDELDEEAEGEDDQEQEIDEHADVDAIQEEAEAAVQPGTQRSWQQRRFDRKRGRRGAGRPQRGGMRPPRRDFQRQNIQITDLLKEGQEVLIQIAKEPIGKKGARITSHIALPGRFLVYMPTVNHIGVSRKINSEEERQRLKRIMLSEREGGHGGFIVRTAAAGIGEDDLRADIRFLKNLWHEIKSRAEKAKSPALIYHDLNLVERVLRDQVTSDFNTIWVDTEQEYERILRFANRFQPSLVRKVKLYTKNTPLFEQFGIQEEINKALKSKVWLKSGGYIVINQTEALVAIDINTGKYVGKTTRLEDTIVKTNIDAIKEIVRQIRLRDLGGIIVIDFIDMDERKNRQKVMQELELALKADRAPSKVLQFNDFGLVAITRKRVKQSLERTLGAPCPYCTGTGLVKSVTTVCNEIYTEARKLAREMNKEDVVLRCNPDVAKALKGNGGRLVNEIEELVGRTVIVKPDPMLHTEQYDFN